MYMYVYTYSIQWVCMDLHVKVTCTQKNVGVRHFVMCVLLYVQSKFGEAAQLYKKAGQEQKVSLRHVFQHFV